MAGKKKKTVTARYREMLLLLARYGVPRDTLAGMLLLVRELMGLAKGETKVLRFQHLADLAGVSQTSILRACDKAMSAGMISKHPDGWMLEPVHLWRREPLKELKLLSRLKTGDEEERKYILIKADDLTP